MPGKIIDKYLLEMIIFVFAVLLGSH